MTDENVTSIPGSPEPAQHAPNRNLALELARVTEAAAMADQVPHEVKIERMERLVELTQAIARERNRSRIGRVRRG